MFESKDDVEMAFCSIECFKKHGKLDAKELQSIIDIAERDGVIDQNKIRVLQKNISNIKPKKIDRAMQKKACRTC